MFFEKFVGKSRFRQAGVMAVDGVGKLLGHAYQKRAEPNVYIIPIFAIYGIPEDIASGREDNLNEIKLMGLP